MICLILVGGLIWLTRTWFDFTAPIIRLEPETGLLGVKQQFTLALSDEKSGLSQVKVWLRQGEHQKEILSQNFPGRRLGRGGQEHQTQLAFEIDTKAWGFQEGPAALHVEARDFALMGWFRGNRAELVRPLTIDLTPLRLSVISINEFLNQGGTGLVTYTVNKPVAKTGLLVNGVFFPGYRVKGKEGGHFLAFFAIPYDLPRPLTLELMAEDLSGTTLRTKLLYRLKPRRWRMDTLQISDAFLQQKLAEFQDMNPEFKKLSDPLAVFLQVNQQERLRNDQFILELCRESQPEPLWQGPFVRLPRSKPMASFADHRTYKYQGREIDKQVHLGQDLASLERAEVPAGNGGLVIFTGNLGIYGNTIVLDHGLGIFSLYSHLSEIKVSKNQKVQKGDILGHTGATGMAGGDHLHFAVAIHGHFVNPVEWWDAHWLKDQVYRQFALAGLPVPKITATSSPEDTPAAASPAPGSPKKKKKRP